MVNIFNVAAGSLHWICQVAAPCHVTRGSGMTWHWIHRWQHPAMWHVVLRWHNIEFTLRQHTAMWQEALGWRHWIRQVAAPCSVIRASWIMTLNLPGGSTLQCGTWLWDDNPLNSPKRLPYWNSTSVFDVDRITTVDMSFCTSLQNFI